MLLYFHVPFCRSKCRYCAFYSEAVGGSGLLSESALQLWKSALLREMEEWSGRLGHPSVRTLFFGGGTPSLLPPPVLASVLDRAAALFTIEDAAEISMEANPESVTLETARQYRDAGINRVSLGAQSMDDGELALIGRRHRAADVGRAVSQLREAGIANVGLDLIWGLPGQSYEVWASHIRAAAALGADHLSCYGLTLEEGTPLLDMCRRGTVPPLPDEVTAERMYMEGGALLEELGYRQYEISNYARAGRECRHNMGYWDNEDYLGFGPAATSTLGTRRWTNPYNTREWAALVEEGRIGHEAEELDLGVRMQEMIMLRLRTVKGLESEAYRRLCGRDFEADNRELLEALLSGGLMRKEAGFFRLTRRGMLLSNSIIERFFDTVREELPLCTLNKGEC